MLFVDEDSRSQYKPTYDLRGIGCECFVCLRPCTMLSTTPKRSIPGARASGATRNGPKLIFASVADEAFLRLASKRVVLFTGRPHILVMLVSISCSALIDGMNIARTEAHRMTQWFCRLDVALTPAGEAVIPELLPFGWVLQRYAHA